MKLRIGEPLKTNHRVKYKPIEVGDRFGRLVVTAFAKTRKGSGTNQLYWLCQCDCGIESVKRDANLKNGTTKSCGCLQPIVAAVTSKQTLTTHGEAANGKESIEYKAWRGMFRRVDTPSEKTKRHYQDRGVKICQGLRGSYVFFLSIVRRCPEGKTTLDRANNNGHYSCGRCSQCIELDWPLNIRWASWREQARNKRQRNQYTGPAPLERVA